MYLDNDKCYEMLVSEEEGADYRLVVLDKDTKEMLDITFWNFTCQYTPEMINTNTEITRP